MNKEERQIRNIFLSYNIKDRLKPLTFLPDPTTVHSEGGGGGDGVRSTLFTTFQGTILGVDGRETWLCTSGFGAGVSTN